MARGVKAVLAVFAVIALGMFALWELAKYRLEHARFIEHLAIVADAPGYSVAAAETAIADPLEEALGSIEGVGSLRTLVRPGSVTISTDVTVIGVSSRHPVELVHEALEKSLRTLPSELGPPLVMRVDPDPTLRRFIARSETMTRVELTKWLEDVFRRQVEVQPGVREITLCGAREPELKITLDQARVRAVGLSAAQVLEAIRRANVQLPAGSIDESAFHIRLARGRLEDLETIELRELDGAQVRLRDVAMLQLTGEEGACTSARDLLVTVRVMPESEPMKLPSQAGVTLTPFTAKRVAIFLSPAGTSVREAIAALQRVYPDAMITAERDELTVLFPEAPRRLEEAPGLALRSLDERHSVVEVSGPDFDQLVTLAGQARQLLVNQPARWVGAAWPGLAPEKVLEPVAGVKGLAEALQLVIGGVNVGRLDDGSNIRVVAGASLDDLVLADGRRATDVLEIREELGPAAMLRVNRERTVELEVGLEPGAVRQALEALQLPQGYSVTVTERGG